MTYRKNILSKIVLALLGVSIAASLIGAKMDSGLPTVEVADIANGTADHVLGWDGSGVAVSQSREGARVFNSGNISIPNSSNTALTFNSERWDDNGLHSTVSNTSRLTAIVEGRYLICAQTTWAASSSGNRNLSFQINGSGFPGLIANKPLSAGKSHYILCILTNLAADDYVEVIVFQDSGGALNVTVEANRSPEFMMQRLRSQ